MTAAIQKMMAEKAKEEARIAADIAWQEEAIAISNRPVAGEIEEMIRKSAPFMDEHTLPGNWQPSKLLMIAWNIGAAGTTGPKRADLWAMQMLETARRRYIAGMDPNPFLGRPTASQMKSATLERNERRGG